MSPGVIAYASAVAFASLVGLIAAGLGFYWIHKEKKEKQNKS